MKKKNNQDKPELLILSSSKYPSYIMAKGVKENLKNHFKVTLWREGFFPKDDVSPLNTFLKKLIYFDIGVLIMAPDDIRINSENPDEQIHVPRDNVILELGATMARFGTHKTFILKSEKPDVQLPSYFDNISTLVYKDKKYGKVATKDACNDIINKLHNLKGRIFHSDLPAIGLTFGYFYNFVKPIYNSLKEPQKIKTGKNSAKWDPDDGFTLTILIPKKFMTRQDADNFSTSKLGTVNISVLLKDGRDISVYVLDRPSSGLPLHIIDIPTTLFTSMRVISRVDKYWSENDRKKDVEFLSRLEQREIAAFQRQIKKLIDDDDLGHLYIVPQDNLNQHINFLKKL